MILNLNGVKFKKEDKEKFLELSDKVNLSKSLEQIVSDFKNYKNTSKEVYKRNIYKIKQNLIEEKIKKRTLNKKTNLEIKKIKANLNSNIKKIESKSKTAF
ncbi:MAG: hypothetical protein HRT99_00555, partial [Mycoplasmatales bacterium]|nr:hypothetical protein [Mycoplasmatales bacterium]